MLQPPARDYLPRRSGQTAVPGLQAYAFFHHKTYDAAEKCFVPGKVILVAGEDAERTDDFFEWKSARLLLLGPGRLFGGSTPLCCFRAAACAALHFSLQVFAQAFGDNSG